MKILYLDCSMGAAGDMLTGALLELLPDPDKFVREFNALGIPGVEMIREKAVRCGIQGTHVSIRVNGVEEGEDMPAHHAHRGMEEIGQIFSGLPVSESVRSHARAVYSLIAQAESHVHGIPVTEIHFHEVGTMDAVADVTAVCMLMEQLAPEAVAATPVHVGSGTVRCAHGILPVPAPATAYLLQGIPIYGGQIRGELCTPTGAALLKHFVDSFGDLFPMQLLATGYGMGRKEFPQANCVRAMLGEREGRRDQAVELSCSVDDMTGEQIGFALERFLEAGALDAYTAAIGMKKGRPGTLIRVLCRREEEQKLVSLIFRHTTTLGLRRELQDRYVLDRSLREVKSPYGIIRRKDSHRWGVTRQKYEYEDLAGIARERDMSLFELLAELD